MTKAVKYICSCVHRLFTFGSLYFSRRHTLSVARSAFLCKKSASLSILKEKKTCPLLLGSDASWVMLERLSAINELQVFTSFLILWFTGCSPHLDVGFWRCCVTIKWHRLNSNQPHQQLHTDVSMKPLESGIYSVRCVAACVFVFSRPDSYISLSQLQMGLLGETDLSRYSTTISKCLPTNPAVANNLHRLYQMLLLQVSQDRCCRPE